MEAGPFYRIYTLPGILLGDQIWTSIPKYNDRLGSNADIALSIASLALSAATNAVMTMMIGYRLWYVVAGGVRWIQ